MSNKNSLTRALDFKIAEAYNILKSQGPIPTSVQIYDHIKANFTRTPQDLVKTHINQYIQRQTVEPAVQKKQKTNTLSMNITELSQLGGMDHVIEQIKKMILLPITQKDLFNEMQISPLKGVLLTGISGSGKTALGLALCKFLQDQYQIEFVYRSATEIVAGISGESEQNVRKVFQEAKKEEGCVLFLDELDAIAGKKENAQKDMEKRVVIQLQQCLDTLDDKTLVIAACSKPENLDPALRRAGRFDKEFSLPVPDEKMRYEIVKKMLESAKISQDVDTKELARNTPGYVPADLSSLTKEAGLIAVQRIVDTQNQDHCITMNDFNQALKTIQPTAKREGFAVVPDVCWKDIGALNELKDELQNSIILPIVHPEKFKNMGIEAPAGVLLYGPPGCGKTLLAKAVANASQANFIAIKGPELLNKYVGESEKAVRNLFQRARFSQPCIIFFDELDALCPKRGQEGNGSSERVVNQLLTEMQGLEERQQVYVIAATNRPDMIDSAMLRPGRLDKLLYVPMPNIQDQISILKTCGNKSPIQQEVWTTLENYAQDKRLEGYSGADLGAIIKQAALAAILDQKEEISINHINVALNKVKPSLSLKDQLSYEKLRNLQENKSNFQNGHYQ